MSFKFDLDSIDQELDQKESVPQPQPQPQPQASDSLLSKLGNTVKAPSVAASERKETVNALKGVSNSTVIGQVYKPAGKPAVKANSFGAPAQIGWKTFQSQKETLRALVTATGLTNTDVLEAALALAVKEFQRKSNLDAVDLSLARDPNQVVSK